VGLHATIHLELVNAGENANDGIRRALFLTAFESDSLLRDEVEILFITRKRSPSEDLQSATSF